MSIRVSVAHAARMSTRSEKTVRRWIASGKLPAQKVDGAYAIDPADLAQIVGDMSNPVSTPEVDTDVHPQVDTRLDIRQAEAMAAYTRSLLEPLVEHVARLEGTVRDQAEQLGQLRAERDAARVALTVERRAHSPGAANLTHESSDPTTEPDPAPEPSPWPIPLRRNVRALAPWLLLVAILGAAIVAGRWPF
jgi:hypothetical protein